MWSELRYFGASIRGTPLKVYGISLFGLIMSNADQSLFSYATPGIMKEFGIGLGAIGWILSMSFLAAALATFALGVVADRHGRRGVFVFCLIGPALLVGLQSFAPSVEVLTILRAAAFGISSALPTVATTYTIEVAPDRYRGMLAGLLQLGYPIGWFAASLFSAPLLATYGWRALFLPAFLVIPVGLALVTRLSESDRFVAATLGRDPTPRGLRVHLGQLREPVVRRRALLCFWALFLFGGAYGGTAFYFPTYLTEARRYSESAAVTLVGASYGVGVFGYLAAAFIGEFWLSRRNTAALWLVLGAAAMMGLFWLSVGRASDLAWFCLMTTFFYGAFVVISPLTAELFPTSVRASAAAFATAGLLAGMGVYPVLVSQLVGVVGWRLTFSLVVAPSIAMSAVLLLMLDNTRSGTTLDEVSAAPARAD